MLVGLRLTPAPRAALLARDRARSDDLEAGDDPDPVRPPAEPPIHPFTGKFADSEHTVASAKRPEQRRRACVEAYEAMLMERRDSRRRGHIFRPRGAVVDGADCAQKDAPDSS